MIKPITSVICWILLCVSMFITSARAQESTSRPTTAITIAKCEWIMFKTEGDNPQVLPALRIVSDGGKDGLWVGESWMGRKPAEIMPRLDKLTGLDVSSPEAAWATVSKLNFGTASIGVDIAIWDLYGRSQGKPVGELLGPRRRDKVALYLAGIPNKTIKENVALAQAAQKRGVHAFKIYAYLEGYGPKRKSADKEEAAKWVAQDIELAGAVRAAVGDSFLLMFYNNCCYNLDQAIQVGRALDELHYAIYFDPMPENANDSMANYLELKKSIKTPVAAFFNGPSGGLALRIEWMAKKALDVNQTDVYGAFTPCVQLIKACEKAGVPMDLHGGFPSDYYQFPLYAFTDDKTLPQIGWHLPYPGGTPPISKTFKGSTPGDAKTPWIKRMQARPVDADGFVHLVYDIPGMGVEFDWDWIKRHDTAGSQTR